MSSSYQTQKVSGRTNCLETEDYYMAAAVLTAQRSPDPSTQVGACFVKNDRVVGLGCNNFPNGCADRFNWSRDDRNPLEAKYFFVVHAEPNGLLRALPDDIRGSRLYVTLFPCNECAKLVIQAGVEEVIYLSDKYAESDSKIASKLMLDTAGVKYRKFTSNRNIVEINLCE